MGDAFVISYIGCSVGLLMKKSIRILFGLVSKYKSPHEWKSLSCYFPIIKSKFNVNMYSYVTTTILEKFRAFLEINNAKNKLQESLYKKCVSCEKWLH